MRAALTNKPPTIYGDGEQTRDFTYVDDVVEANMLVLKAGKKACGEVFNIAGGKPVSVNALWSEIASLAGASAQPRHEKEREGDIKHSYADSSKARETLGFKTEYGLKEGLKKTIEWFRVQS
jgi:nucleoside-diphosphate-sugar epimerase